MNNLTLLVMAAGMGSRYGGLKQLDEVGPSGENIIDYSVYEAIKAVFEDNLPAKVPLYNEYHALIVMVGKHYCKPKMQCEECPLENVHRKGNVHRTRQTMRRAGSTKSPRKIKSGKKRKY